MVCNTFMCTILFGILELSKIISFKDFILEIIEFKVATLASIIFPTRSLNKAILDDFNRSRIVKINVLHFMYSVIVVYAIFSRVYTSMHYGTTKIISTQMTQNKM